MNHSEHAVDRGNLAFRNLHGRILQNKNELYLLPADGPEMERLTVQHRMLTLALGSLYWPVDEVRKTLAPRGDRPVRVLDIGSGSGAWAVAIAKEFPSVEVLGVDLSPVTPSDTPPNCRFEYADVVLDDLSRFHGMFDVVHSRLVGGGVRVYKPYLWRVIPTVRPGGLFLIAEGDLELYDENKIPIKRAQCGDEPGSSSWFARMTGEVNDRVQIWADCPGSLWYKISSWLRANEYLTDLQELEFFQAIGWNDVDEGKVDTKVEAARLALSNSMSFPKAIGPGLIASGVPEEEVDLWIRRSEAELLERKPKLYCHYNYYAARAKA